MMKKALIFLLGLFLFVCAYFYHEKAHWLKEIKNNITTETNESFRNPDRGVYYIYGYLVKDEDADFSDLIDRINKENSQTSLSLIEINLKQYNAGKISETGLKNIERLFNELRSTGKHLIVRFLYDVNGEAVYSEPDDINIIFTHMEQLQKILSDNEDIIYTFQGLFIGNWGEMNGSKYSNESLGILAEKFYQIMPKNTFMSVRMPAQWRWITRYEDDLKLLKEGTGLESRLGLFNDGMMYSWSDYGTYKENSKEEAGYYGVWNREEELDFQEKLCESVPNGGEVVGNSEYSDLDNAIYNLSKMHVSYLNLDYDQRVFDKWESSLIENDELYNGINGKKYIIDHLGYRFVIFDNSLNYDRTGNKIKLSFSIKNVGFAPIYSDTEIKVRFISSNNEKTVELKSDLKDLSGGLNDDHQRYELSMHLGELIRDDYDIYVYIEDERKNEIVCANKPYFAQKGLFLGNIVTKNELFDQK